jgi:hypothetical protein
MEKLNLDEFDALITDLSGPLGRPGEEAAAGQLGGTTTRTILSDVRANVSLSDDMNRTTAGDKLRF